MRARKMLSQYVNNAYFPREGGLVSPKKTA